MKKYLFLAVMMLIGASSLNAASPKKKAKEMTPEAKGVASINRATAEAHVDFLACDELEGREAGWKAFQNRHGNAMTHKFSRAAASGNVNRLTNLVYCRFSGLLVCLGGVAEVRNKCTTAGNGVWCRAAGNSTAVTGQ